MSSRSPAVTGIWFSTRDEDIPLITSMGRRHPLWGPLEECDDPLSWDDAYNVEKNTVEALKLVIEECRDQMVNLHAGDEPRPRADYVPGLEVVRVLPDGRVMFSGVDFMEQVCFLRGTDAGRVLDDFEQGIITESELQPILDAVVFPDDAFVVEAETIYDAYGALVPGLGEERAWGAVGWRGRSERSFRRSAPPSAAGSEIQIVHPARPLGLPGCPSLTRPRLSIV